MSAAPILTILRNGEKIEERSLEGDILLGRGEDCGIRLEDRAISRMHALLRSSPEGFQIEKKSEFAPMSVNGEECTQALVKMGDIVELGPYLLKLEARSVGMTSPPGQGGDSVDLEPAERMTPMDEQGLEENDGDILGDLGPAIPVEEVESEASLSGGEDLISFDSPEQDGSVEEQADSADAFGMGSLEGDLEAPLDEIGGGSEDPAVSDKTNVGALVENDGATKVNFSTGLEVKLVLPPGAANVTDFVIDQDEVIIGRGKSCDVVLNDKRASRKNTVIRRAGIRFYIKDLNSANGTLVNESPIQEQELSGEDVIRIGDTSFVFKATSAEYAQNEAHFITPESEPGIFDDMEGYSQKDEELQDLGYSSQPEEEFALAPGVPISGAPMGIPGISEMGTSPGMDTKGANAGSWVEKAKAFWKDPKKRKTLIYVLVVLAGAWMMFDEEQAPQPTKVTKKSKAGKGSRLFESLSAGDKRFVESQHALAFDHFRAHEYDKALYEIEKIFQYVDDYKDAREIKRYAIEGKRKMEALEQERKKKEEEARIKARVEELLVEGRGLMEKEKYEELQRIFPEILSLDPENSEVAGWQRTIESIEEQRRLKEQEKQIQSQINEDAWNIFKQGQTLQGQEKFLEAVDMYRRIPDTGANDKKLLDQTQQAISECLETVKSRLEPVLNEANQAEQNGELEAAYKLYEKAMGIDPRNKEAPAGMARIRDVLHEKAKVIYTEGVIAESYSDFKTAEDKFRRCLEVAPKDDPYYGRAQRKLARYVHLHTSDEATGGGGDFGNF